MRVHRILGWFAASWCLQLSASAHAEPERRSDARRIPIHGEMVLATDATKGQGLAGLRTAITSVLGLDTKSRLDLRPLVQRPDRTDSGELVLMRTHEELPKHAQHLVAELPTVLWAAPNYRYEGPKPFEYQPNDPQLAEQRILSVVGAQAGWDRTIGDQAIIVAVADEGVDLDHPDLQANIWTNSLEVPNNGIDDDRNGYIDDTHGWDFSSGDNDPRPNSILDSHGTHVAGLIAAVADNGFGVAGLAPGTRIMPLRFYGSGAWTSAIIAETLMYAADNGAKILNTSCNIDVWSGDQVFEAAVAYASERGVLHINSAGNAGRYNPKRLELDDILFVASTETGDDDLDRLSDFSNYGEGVDLSAPGSSSLAPSYGVLSTLPRGGFGRKRGTSMASAATSAAAALIWSLNPDWNRAQVAAQLVGTTTELEQRNPAHAGLMGAGRISLEAALLETAPAPVLRDVRTTTTSVDLRFQGILDPTTVMRSENWLLVNQTGETEEVRFARRYAIGSPFVSIATDHLPTGTYTLFVVSGTVRDPFGRAVRHPEDQALASIHVNQSR